MRLLDEPYTATPFDGIRRMTAWLRSQGGEGQQVYPYLLRGVRIERRHQVWSTEITYIRLRQGFVYLGAVRDWFSRYVLSWRRKRRRDQLDLTPKWSCPRGTPQRHDPTGETPVHHEIAHLPASGRHAPPGARQGNLVSFGTPNG
jgi:transposase InsO family protein